MPGSSIPGVRALGAGPLPPRSQRVPFLLRLHVRSGLRSPRTVRAQMSRQRRVVEKGANMLPRWDSVNSFFFNFILNFQPNLTACIGVWDTCLCFNLEHNIFVRCRMNFTFSRGGSRFLTFFLRGGGGGGGAKIMHTHHERESRSPLWPDPGPV